MAGQGRIGQVTPHRVARSGQLTNHSRVTVLVAATTLLALWLGAGHADAQSFTEFPLTANTHPLGIASGPDGNLWFVEANANQIGRITPTGTITEFPIPTPNSLPVDAVAGPDGNIWFVEFDGNQIGRITPTGAITEFSIPTAASKPQAITAGPDGNLWFAEGADSANNIARITPTGTVTEFSIPTAQSLPRDITTGPDGNLWFVEDHGNKVGRITPTGIITEFRLPTANSSPQFITAGADGNLWFTESSASNVGRIVPGAPNTITEVRISATATFPTGITAGPDGNLWFTVGGAAFGGSGNDISRITPTGTITEFPIPSPSSLPMTITAGPDGDIWATESAAAAKIARLTVPASPLPLCATTPASGCRLAQIGASSVAIRDNVDNTKDQFKWNWAKGAATDVNAFKDPVNGSARYSVCLYDASGNNQPLMEMDVPPHGTCHTVPCWKATGTSGFSYRISKAGTLTGITTVKLSAGAAGEAKVQAKGRGPNLPTPALGLTLPVIVQLMIGDGTTECWQTTYSTATRNDAARFTAKGP